MQVMEVIELIGVIAAVILASVMGYNTYLMHKTTKSNVVVYLRRCQINKSCLIFCVKNTGKFIAKDVQFILPEVNIKAAHWIPITEIGFLKQGIPDLIGGEKYEFLININENDWNELKESCYEVTVSWGNRRRKENTFLLKFGCYENVPLIKDPEIHLAERFDKNTKAIEKSSKRR